MRKGIPPYLGSVLRFSQPLNGFLANSGFVALFHATTISGVLPSEFSPRRSCVLFSEPLAPLRLFTRMQEAALYALRQQFPRLPHFHAVA
jgi:hypothetical protein